VERKPHKRLFIRELVPDWRPTKKQVLWAIGLGLALIASILLAFVVGIGMDNRFGYVPLVLVLFFILIRIGYRYEWTGFGETSHPKDETKDIKPPKTLWDWMQLLFVPAMLALLAGGLTWWQTSSERARLAEEQARQEAIRAEEAAVQIYLDQMTNLILERDLREDRAAVRDLAQARTSAVLRAVGPENKRTLLLFLYDTDLISVPSPIISLSDIDLSDTNLSGVVLLGADLSETNLSEANLSGADLNRVDLREADLEEANLEDAALEEANLEDANLTGAKLGDGLDANDQGANLEGANLADANLTDAILDGAVLIDANVTRDQLDKASSLEGAIMPDGSKHP
jgi:hypothetical protein